MGLGIWSEDVLNREAEALALLGFLQTRIEDRAKAGRTASYVLNLDAQWGHGKTFFLSRFRRELEDREHIVALVNAWETDFSEEPLVAIMSAIDEALQPLLKKDGPIKKAWRTALGSGGTLAASLMKNVAAKAASRYAGNFLEEASEVIGIGHQPDKLPKGKLPSPAEDELGVEKGIEEGVEKLADRALEQLLKPFRQQERSIAIFKSQLAKVASSIKPGRKPPRRIFVLVDELDRCRPSYAIRLLEAAKHLFETNGVVFVIATDTEQLAESVKAVYGANFDGKRYLQRFFDRTYRFRPPERARFVKAQLQFSMVDLQKIESLRELPIANLATRYFDAFELSLRDIEQCIDILSTVCTVWNKPVKLHAPHLLALIISYQQGYRTLYDYVGGKSNQRPDPLPFIDVKLLEENYRHHSTGDVSTRSVSILGLINVYRGALTKSLNDTELGRGLGEQWLTQKLREELALLHNNSFNWQDLPKSVLHEYPSYVELAVRFADEDPPVERER